ncbi:VOC family protein [Streptomyces boncukensis]|uniref:VOC family protein n=1 Tax=Streptomyces boncukensis TaxID=2711219 RepID=A0A6G4WR37_9ACTN|nr:VOC family protein [Streptomyces boncukensis]NGO67665.1 VOC family protein [Streptomyces boncukensis]
MITTDFVPGSPCWVDLTAPDIDAAGEFYGAVFGWELDRVTERYGFFRQDGKAVGVVGRIHNGAGPGWTPYFSAPEADAAAAAVQAAEGTVRTAPYTMGDEGRLGQFTDPLGGRFGVWEPGQVPGMEAADTVGTLCWTELCTSDLAAATDFYVKVFGWQTQDMAMPGGEGTYRLITPAGLGEDRAAGGAVEMPAQELPGGTAYWQPAFAVADCDATAARVTESGGRVTLGPEYAEGVGRFAVCTDPSGAPFVLLPPSKPA